MPPGLQLSSMFGKKKGDVAPGFLEHAGVRSVLDTLSTLQKLNIEWTQRKVWGYLLSEYVCAATTILDNM